MQSIQLAAATVASSSISRSAFADPLGGPIGIQLYTVNGPMQEDPAGTLAKLGKIGFRQVESAGFGKLPAGQFRKLIDDAGLSCPSAHLSFQLDKLDATFDDAHALGASYAVSSMLDSLLPGEKTKNANGKRAMSLDEAKRTAEICNRLGEGAKRAGLQYAYHNHDLEFADQGGGAVGYDVLLRETDPQLVKFEIDCGWMVFAGHDPVQYFRNYPNRFPLIHVKDFLAPANQPAAGEKTAMQGAELGRGVVDYKPIFAAAKKAGLKHYFAEQEGPFARMSQLQAAQVAYEYLHGID